MGTPVDPPVTVDSIRTAVLHAHRYATQPVEATDDFEAQVVFVCSCGIDGSSPTREGLSRMIERHLDKEIRAAFEGTEFEGERGTITLRGFESHVHNSMR